MGSRVQPRRSDRPLKERDLQILKDVIHTYVLCGDPVSSGTVASRANQDLSSASIRNIMADLEAWGYLTQPHTSAGRVPTARGYHLFIDSLMRAQRLPAKERRYIAENLSGASGDAEHLTAVTSQLLSELSHQVGIVLTPARGDTVLEAMEFVPLSSKRILCVVVSASGFVDSRIIETEDPLPRQELVRISNYLTENFAGMTLRQIRDRLLDLMAHDRAQVDRLLANAFTLASQGLMPREGQEVLVDGTESLLAMPELSDLEMVRRFFETFTDKVRLVKMLSECMVGTGVRVYIGDDTDLTSELDFSLVVTTYGVGNVAMGTLGIFGPSRMEYPRMIPLVDYLGETLSQALTEGVLR